MNNVLVVDDESEIRDVIHEYLRNLHRRMKCRYIEIWAKTRSILS
jgi:CheY-like chemotaxis protein